MRRPPRSLADTWKPCSEIIACVAFCRSEYSTKATHEPFLLCRRRRVKPLNALNTPRSWSSLTSAERFATKSVEQADVDACCGCWEETPRLAENGQCSLSLSLFCWSEWGGVRKGTERKRNDERKGWECEVRSYDHFSFSKPLPSIPSWTKRTKCSPAAAAGCNCAAAAAAYKDGCWNCWSAEAGM